MARIVDIQVRAGDTVTKGRLLFRLEKTNLRASEHQAKGQAKAEVRIQEAAQNLGRICQLHERGLIAVADLDMAHGNRIVLQGELASLQSDEAEAATVVSFAEIRSPI